MPKPRGIAWLEEQTDQQLEQPAASGAKARHVSIRVSDELFERLERLAVARNESVSQCARQLLLTGLSDRDEPVVAIDDAISALQRARVHLAS